MGNLLFSFYLLTALVWLARAWRALRALKETPTVEMRSSGSAQPLPSVSVLIPVKNEEDNIGNCLEGLLRQDFPALEIIVTNDHSTDRTPEILSEYSRSHPERVKILNAPPVPPGWTGKNWALAHGAPHAQGEWLLFTDADTRHEPQMIASVLAHAQGKNLDLLTLTPRCLAEGFWEKTLQPAAMAFLGLWFPFAKVNDPDSPVVFGNGQFLMIRKKVYESLGGHEKVKGEFLEDFALVRLAKAARFRIECAFGTKIFGTRMYRSLRGIWLGWRRIYLHAFEKNPARLLAKALSVFAFSTLPFFFFPAGLSVLFLIVLVAWKASEIVGAPRGYSLLHPLAGFILAGILADAAWHALQKKEVKWR
ncbi:MAG: glycosyltransferase [Candidatus Omnitrophica bacterium]|nr:glycosyltransferase [Candidatus Omnitrophota bacterium]